jgi:hypothetical protein
VRLWSLHPRCLDAQGLCALWREGLLARAVLGGKTKGYRHHPQLERFRRAADPRLAIECYLSRVLDEARARGYRFDGRKVRYRRAGWRRTVTAQQLAYEWQHLRAKLARRDPRRLEAIERWLGSPRPGVVTGSACEPTPPPHPCFRVVPGPVAPWERAATVTAAAESRSGRRGTPSADRSSRPR